MEKLYMKKIEVFMKNDNCSIRRRFAIDDDKDWETKFLFDEECYSEGVEIQWIKVNGEKVDIDKFGSSSP